MHKRIFAVLLLCVPLKSFAWGAVGHRASAILAEAELTSTARLAVIGLLGNSSLADVASWADEMRSDGTYPQTRWYHFEKLPDGIPFLENFKDMPDWQRRKGGTVSAVLAAAEILREGSAPKATQTDALKFLVHFVGDLHQPLHTGRPDDLGGVKNAVIWFGTEMSLHRVWDSGMLMTGHGDFLSVTKSVRENAKVYAKYLSEHQSRYVVALGMDVEGWLNESMALRTAAYDTAYLTDQPKYQAAHLDEVDIRIYAAGLRLGALLNSVFDKQPVPPSQAGLKRDIEAIAGDLHKLISFQP